MLVEIWEKLRSRHYDPTLNCLDWPALRGEYLEKLEGVQTVQERYSLYNELLTKLDQSHLLATPPSPPFKIARKNRGPAQAQLHWRWKGDALYLRAPRPGERAVDSRHTKGEIVEVDGLPLATLLDSPTELSWAERAQRIRRMLSCPRGGKKKLKTQQVRGQSRSIEVPCVEAGPQRLSLGKLRNIETQVRGELVDPKAKLGYLAFNVWMLPMVQEIRARLEGMQKQGLKGLVLDLRGNRGGVASMSIPVARLLWPAGGSLGTISMRSFSQELKVRPNSAAFAGPVALLLDEESASTSEIFALGLSAAGRVKIFAAGPSAGMALASVIEGLSDGGVLQYVVGRYRSPARQEAEGRGVAPDRVVPYSLADLRSGGDPVLSAALQDLRAQVLASSGRR